MSVKKLKDCVGSLPMMADSEIKIINDIITKNNYSNCLEWGSGNSTIYFPTQNQSVQKWYSIEHCPSHYALIKNLVSSKVTLVLEKTEINYINKPKNNKYDFILVDGNHRDACLDLAFDLISDTGTIVLHDSARKESARMMSKYKSRIILSTEGEKKLHDGFYAHRGVAVFKK